MASLHTTTLTADRIVFNVTWLNSTDINTAGVKYRQYSDSGEIRREFTGVTLLIDPRQEAPELLAALDSGLGSIEAETNRSGNVRSFLISDEFIARAEWFEQRARIGSRTARPNFEYYVSGPWSGQEHFSAAKVSGDFEVVAHNVTFDVASSDQGRWKVSSGREEDSPTVPGTREVKRRVVILHVYGGTMQTASDEGLELYGPRIESTLNGVASSNSASGRLFRMGLQYQYLDVPFKLEGSGELVVHPTTTGARVNSDQAPSPRLELDVQGSFTIAPTEGLVTNSIPMTPHEMSNSLFPWVGALLVLMVLPIAAVLARARVRRRDQATFRQQSEPRAHLDVVSAPIGLIEAKEKEPGGPEILADISENLKLGRQLLQQERFDDAARWFAAVVQSHPTSSNAYDYLGQAHMRLQRYGRAADAYAMCLRLVEGAEPEVMGDLLRATWLAGRHEEACRVLTGLSKLEPAYAAELIERGGLKELGAAALDGGIELDLDMLEHWSRFAWGEGRRHTAQRVLAAILARRPESAMHIVTNRRYAELARVTLGVLDVHGLKAVVRLAWEHDSLGLARDAVAHLARVDAAGAKRLLADPTYEALRDDLRIQGLLRDTHRNPNSES